MNNIAQRERPIQRIFTLLLVSFLIIRLLLVFVTIEFPRGGITLDSKSYIDLSESIRYEGIYRDPVGDADLRRPLFYPAFLAIFQSKLGLFQPVVILAQLILASLSSLLITWLLNRQGFSTAGMVAGVLIAISPNINLWSMTIMSEVLFTFLLVLAFTFFSLGFITTSKTKFFFTGVFLGLATLTRPVGLVIVGLWVLVALYASVRRWSPSVNIPASSWLIVGSVLVILPWMVRNAVIHKSFAVSDIGTHTLESFNFAVVLSEAEGISRNDATYRLGELGGTWNQFRWVLEEYPVQFVKSQLAGVGRVIWGTEITRWATVIGQRNWDGFGVFRNLREGEWDSALVMVIKTFQTPSEIILLAIYFLSVLHTFFIIILSLVGIVTIKKPDSQEGRLALICTFTALSLILISGAAGQARFRVPVEPFLAVVAGFGWGQIRTRWTMKSSTDFLVRGTTQ
jgi:4-amino-4-deoxy-L-arabinose transferase-like glycosyltransferase